jgi:hypothetical protein
MIDGFREKVARLFQVVAGVEQAIDFRAVSRPLLDLVEIALVRVERVVGLLAKEVAVRGRLAQPASLNCSLLGSKRDRKIVASIGSAKQ